MKLKYWVNYKVLLSIIMLFLMLFLTESCKQKEKINQNTETQTVTWEELKDFGFAEKGVQDKEFDKYKDIIESKNLVEKPERVLRQMSEHVSFYYIEGLLEEISKTTSAKDKPNISVFLKIIKEMKNLDDPNAIEFIEKAKENRNADKLCISLYGLRNELQQAKAADALASLKNPESVTLLAMRLLFAAVMYLNAMGSQGEAITGNLCKSLVKALESCTGFSFPDYNPANEQETLRIVKSCRDWLEKHPQKTEY